MTSVKVLMPDGVISTTRIAITGEIWNKLEDLQIHYRKELGEYQSFAEVVSKLVREEHARLTKDGKLET